MGLILKTDCFWKTASLGRRKSGIFVFIFLLVSVVIDGYPVTKYQVSLLEDRSVIPMVIFELDVPSKEIFKRLLVEKKKETR